MPRVVRGSGRNRTFDLFATAIQNPHPGRVPLLLVDSEEALAAGHSVWQHLHERDHWNRPRDARDDQMFLMVQVMETWLLADRAALGQYFGAPFRPNAIPQWPALEDVSKQDVLGALARATAGCARPYDKGAVSFELLAMIDPALVEATCPRAAALLDDLRAVNA